MKAMVDTWIGSDPKTDEWHQETAKSAKETAKNYSRLLYLYWQNNPRFRAFKGPGQWLREVEEQQHSSDITARRAWGRELSPGLASAIRVFVNEGTRVDQCFLSGD